MAKPLILTVIRTPFFWAVVFRLAMFLGASPLQGDAADYNIIATNLANGHGFSRCWGDPFTPTSQRPPLFPLVLSLFYMAGLGWRSASLALNLICDFVSMNLAGAWARDLKLKRASWAPWTVALCPMLIAYACYPTTENMSITLFLAAGVLVGRGRAKAAGIMWGLLSLCRSYYLLFPLFFLLIRPQLKWKRSVVVTMVILSFAAPAVWMARNYSVIHRVAFTQTSQSGWQAYQGLVYPAFDWWDPQQASEYLNIPVFRSMARSHCMPEAELAELDAEAKGLVLQYALAHPWEVLRNIIMKGINLFIDWGQFMPYTRMGFILKSLINAFMVYYWVCVGALVYRNRRALMLKGGGVGEGMRISLMGMAYVAAVTVPFAIDARYLLGPFLMLLICVLEFTARPWDLLKAAWSRESGST